jgi:RNA polymerase sigma-70 factor (ECF subfamily)
MTAGVEGVLASGCHRAELTAYCRRMLGCPFEAEDAVQETLLRAWRGSRRFEGRAALRTWLYRIATNVCLDSLRHAGRRPVPVDDVLEPADAGGEPDPSDSVAERERLHLAIGVAIGTLPPRQRAALLLHDVLSWRASEIADLLDTTTVGVNSALQRARAALEAVDPDRVSDVTSPSGRALAARYLAAFANDDVDALVSLSRAV